MSFNLSDSWLSNEDPLSIILYLIKAFCRQNKKLINHKIKWNSQFLLFTPHSALLASHPIVTEALALVPSSALRLTVAKSPALVLPSWMTRHISANTMFKCLLNKMPSYLRLRMSHKKLVLVKMELLPSISVVPELSREINLARNRALHLA